MMPDRSDPRISGRTVVIAIISGVIVVAAGAGFYVLEFGGHGPGYPKIAVSYGDTSRNYSWDTTPNGSVSPNFGFTNDSTGIRLNSTGALSVLTLDVQSGGYSGSAPCDCGVGVLFYIFMVRASGEISAGLDPSSVSIEVTALGVNTDPFKAVFATSATPWSPENVSTGYFSQPPNFSGVGSLIRVTSFENLSAGHGADFFFQMPIQIQPKLFPIENNTTGTNTFQFTASLGGLGEMVDCYVDISLANHYS
jgi:hypothetical protein